MARLRTQMMNRDQNGDAGGDQGAPAAPPAAPPDLGPGGKIGAGAPPPPPGQDLGGEGRLGETPRDRASGAISSTPRRPMEPTPMAGSTDLMGSVPFQPMGSPDVGTMVNSKAGLFGGLGGLKGGGLGVPLDPTSNTPNDPISGLIQLLQGQIGGGPVGQQPMGPIDRPNSGRSPSGGGGFRLPVQKRPGPFGGY